jgi:1,5-anhydro-D-fructose reductase (1,5-anhydro-D-mannitol-forming)
MAGDMTLGWGIVGLGAIASRVSPAISDARNCSVAAVCSRDPAKAAAYGVRLGAAPYSSYEAMLADEAVNAVYIATPNSLHVAQALLAIQAGKHVLVEKPMALTAEDAARLVRAAEEARLQLSVGFHLRHHPVHQEIRRLVGAGQAGPVSFVAATFGSYWADPPPDAWQLDEALAGHGSITGLGVHLLDLLPWLIGQEIVEVSAFSDGPGGERPVEFLTVAILRFDGGAFGHVLCSRRLANPSNSIVVYGDSLRLDSVQTVGMEATGHLERVEATGTSRYEPRLSDLYQRQFESFAHACAGTGELEATGRDGVRNAAVMEAVARSARTGRAVPLNLDEAGR